MEFLAQLPDFGGGIRTVLAFVLALSVIVAIHEYGHYIVGRWCGIKADVFSIGFGPVVFSRVDRRGTRWQIAALPLGGYVKFKGDADAASGRDAEVMSSLSPEAARDTMHGAPLWARAATVAAGPVFNFIFSALIFAAVAFSVGVASGDARVGAVQPLPQEQPLREGDLITALNGVPVASLREFAQQASELPPAPSATYTVEREGRILQLEGPFPFPPRAAQVNPDSPAQDAGLKAGDVILAVNGQDISSFNELREVVAAAGGSAVTLRIWRSGTAQEISLSPRRMDVPRAEGGFETRWLIGVTGGLVFEPETRVAGPLEALTTGVSQVWLTIKTSISGLWHMITGAISSCNLRGPIGIAQSSGNAADQGAFSFILFIGMLSTAVGLMNLFPIPVLDGGHLVFHAWEAVTGKPPSDRALRGLMSAGLALLLGLMVFALTNDLFCP